MNDERAKCTVRLALNTNVNNKQKHKTTNAQQALQNPVKLMCAVHTNSFQKDGYHCEVGKERRWCIERRIKPEGTRKTYERIIPLGFVLNHKCKLQWISVMWWLPLRMCIGSLWTFSKYYIIFYTCLLFCVYLYEKSAIIQSDPFQILFPQCGELSRLLYQLELSLMSV